MRHYTNRKRIKGLILKKGDKVYLVRRNIKLDKLTKKLDAIKLELFEIKTKKGLVSYELELPKTMRIYPIFYMSLLELVILNSTL